MFSFKVGIGLPFNLCNMGRFGPSSKCHFQLAVKRPIP